MAVRGLVVVHGIGDQEQADFLLEVLNSLANWVAEASKHIVGCDALIRAGVLPAKATLFVRDPASPPGVNLAEWRVVEAYWQKAFPPPPYGAMLGWAASLAGRQVGSIVRGLGRNLTGSPAGIRHGVPWYVYDFLARLTAFLLVVVSTLVIWLLVLLSLVLHLVRRFPGVPSVLTALEAGLRRFLVRGLGDAKVYIDERIWAANARREFEVAFETVARDAQVESVTIVAHSWGAVVAYEALSNSRVMAPYSPGGQHAKPIHLITCGSGLNRAWDMVRSKPNDHHSWYRLNRPLVNVANWLDIWADFDPVPAGFARPLSQASQPFVTTLSRPASRPVTNLDEPLNDHGGYWTNDEMVLPHIVAALQQGGPQIPGTAFDAMAQRRRENQVAWLSLLRALVLAAVVTVAVWATLNPGAARDVLAALRDAVRALPSVGSAVMDGLAWLTGFLPRGLLVWLAWVVGGFIVATVIYRLIQLVAFPRLN